MSAETRPVESSTAIHFELKPEITSQSQQLPAQPATQPTQEEYKE